jgi:hypothetical protein
VSGLWETVILEHYEKAYDETEDHQVLVLLFQELWVTYCIAIYQIPKMVWFHFLCRIFETERGFQYLCCGPYKGVFLLHWFYDFQCWVFLIRYLFIATICANVVIYMLTLEKCYRIGKLWWEGNSLFFVL